MARPAQRPPYLIVSEQEEELPTQLMNESVFRCHWCHPKCWHWLHVWGKRKGLISMEAQCFENLFLPNIWGIQPTPSSYLGIAKIVLLWLPRSWGWGRLVEHDITGWRPDIHGLEKPLQILSFCYFPTPIPLGIPGKKEEKIWEKANWGDRREVRLGNLVSLSSLSSQEREEYLRDAHRKLGKVAL